MKLGKHVANGCAYDEEIVAPVSRDAIHESPRSPRRTTENSGSAQDAAAPVADPAPVPVRATGR